METHFEVIADVYEFDDVMTCPYRPDVACLGVAVDIEKGVHMVVQLGPEIRFWLGPSSRQVERRINVLHAAMIEAGGSAVVAERVREWLRDLWDGLVDLQGVLRDGLTTSGQ